MKELIRHVVEGRAWSEDSAAFVEGCDFAELAKALIALSRDEATLQTWGGSRRLEEFDRLGKIAAVSAESDEVDAAIEARLAGSEHDELIEALARAGVAWTHPSLEGALDEDKTRAAAALSLAVADPDALGGWLEDCDVFEDAVVALRAVAMAGATSLTDVVHEWRAQVGEFDEAGAEIASIDGMMAVLDADAYARRVLGGEADIAWLSDSKMVADFLQVYGPGQWLSVLAFLDICDDDAFEFGAFLSVCAAQGMGFEEPDDDQARDLIELLSFEPTADPEDWEPLATRLGLGFAVALAVDDDLALLGAQVGAHERLVTFGYHSPGVPGLPMSGTDPEQLDFEASTGMLRQLLDGPSMPDAAEVAVIRTLYDLYNHVAFGQGRCDAHAEKWASRFADSDVDAIALAARHLRAALGHSAVAAERDRMEERPSLRSAIVLAAAGESEPSVVESLAGAAGGQKVLGLAATQQLALLGTYDALDEVARLWASGPVFRAPIYRDAILTGAHVLEEASTAS